MQGLNDFQAPATHSMESFSIFPLLCVCVFFFILPHFFLLLLSFLFLHKFQYKQSLNQIAQTNNDNNTHILSN